MSTKGGRRNGGGPNASLPRGGFAKVSYQSLSKGGGMFVARSAIESDALGGLEMDHLVASFERNDLTDLERVHFTLGRQPAPNRVITLADGSPYTPDVRVTLVDGRTIYVEIGPYVHKSHPAEFARLQEAMTILRAEGSELVVITERVVRRGYRLDNVNKLLPFLHPISAAPALVERARGPLCLPGRLTATEAAAWLRDRSDDDLAVETCDEAVWSAVARGMASGRLDLDLDYARIDEGTRLTIMSDDAPPRRSWLEGLLAADDPLPPAVATPEALPSGASVVQIFAGDRSPENEAKLQKRLRILRAREANPDFTWQQLAAAVGESVSACRYYCKRSMGTTWANHTERRGDEAVMPERAASGMRVPEIYREVVRRIYATPRAPSVKNLWRNAELKSLRREHGIRVSYWQLRRHVRNVLDRDPWVLAKRAGRPVMPAPAFAGDPDWIRRITVPGQVIQVDYERMDIFINDDEGTGSFRPFLLAAVDVATRCVCAWVLCATEPSEADYRALLHMLFAPKDAFLRRYGLEQRRAGDRHPFPCQGLPQIIIADRGWIFTAHDSRQLLTEMLGIRVEHAAEFQPTMKAIIERLFRSINDLFLYRLPGSVKA